MKQCIKCLEFKEETEFNTCGKYKDKIYRRGDCKICAGLYKKTEKCKTSAKQYRQTIEYKKWRKEYKQLDHVIAKNIIYEEKHKEKRREQKRIRHKYRYYNDILYKITHLCRVRIKELLKTKQWGKTHFHEYIGCTKEELKNHLGSKFQEGMTWDNHGKWHIDHIIPLDSAKTEEELYKLCHYTNLQPLWAEDNLKKSNKIE